MKLKDARFHSFLIEMLYQYFMRWKFRPSKKRDWHVSCTWGDGNYVLRGVREKELPKMLASGQRIIYIDSANGIVFVDNGTGPKPTSIPS